MKTTKACRSVHTAPAELLLDALVQHGLMRPGGLEASLYVSLRSLGLTCRGARTRIDEYRSCLRTALTPDCIFVGGKIYPFDEHVGRFAVYACDRTSPYEQLWDMSRDDEAPIGVRCGKMSFDVAVDWRPFAGNDILSDDADVCFLRVSTDDKRLSVKTAWIDLEVAACLSCGQRVLRRTKTVKQLQNKVDEVLRLVGLRVPDPVREDWTALLAESCEFKEWRYDVVRPADVHKNAYSLGGFRDRLMLLVSALPRGLCNLRNSFAACEFLYSRIAGDADRCVRLIAAEMPFRYATWI